MKTLFIILALLFSGCMKNHIREYYVISYEPDPLIGRKLSEPYPFTLRVKRFDIEKVYGRPNIVYRESPFKLQYYHYRHWAVRPADMITDLIFNHITYLEMVDQLVRRLDEGGVPDYELHGVIHAIEEYDSDELWFAHLSIRYQLTRLSDNRIVYNRTFSKRKRVNVHTPAAVVMALSQIMDFTASELMKDLDRTFHNEFQRKDL